MSQLSAEDEAELQSLLKQLLRSINDKISDAPSTECAEEILLHLEETDKNFHNYEFVKYLRQYVESSLGSVVEEETKNLTRRDGQHAIGSGHDTLIHAVTQKTRDSAEYQQMMQTLKNTMTIVVECLINKFEEDQMRKEEMHREKQHNQSNSQYIDNCSDSDSSFNQSYAFIRQEQLQALAEKLDSSRPKEVRWEALQALCCAPPSDVLSCESWSSLRRNLCAALTDPGLSDNVLQFFAKIFSSSPLNVTREIYTSLAKSVESSFLSHKLSFPTGSAAIDVNRPEISRLLKQIRLMNDFQKEVTTFWIRHPEKYMEGVIESTFSLLSFHHEHGSASPGTEKALEPIHLLALLDIKATWFKKWMHGYYSRTVVLRLLERKYKSLVSDLILGQYLSQTPVLFSVNVSGSVQRGVYTGKELEYAFFVHSLCVLGKLLIYINGRKLFPIRVRKRKDPVNLTDLVVILINIIYQHPKPLHSDASHTGEVLWMLCERTECAAECLYQTPVIETLLAPVIALGKKTRYNSLDIFLSTTSHIVHIKKNLVSCVSCQQISLSLICRTFAAHVIVQFTLRLLDKELSSLSESDMSHTSCGAFIFVCRQMYNTCEGLQVLRPYGLHKAVAAAWKKTSSLSERVPTPVPGAAAGTSTQDVHIWEETLLDSLLNFAATPKGLLLLQQTGAINECLSYMFSRFTKKLQVSRCEKFGYGVMVTQVAATAPGVAALHSSGFVRALVVELWSVLECGSEDVGVVRPKPTPMDPIDRSCLKVLCVCVFLFCTITAVFFFTPSHFTPQDLIDRLIAVNSDAKIHSLFHYEQSHTFGLRLLSVLCCNLDSFLLLESQYNICSMLLQSQRENVTEEFIIDNLSVERNHVLVRVSVVGGPSERKLPPRALQEGEDPYPWPMFSSYPLPPCYTLDPPKIHHNSLGRKNVDEVDNMNWIDRYLTIMYVLSFIYRYGSYRKFLTEDAVNGLTLLMKHIKIFLSTQRVKTASELITQQDGYQGHDWLTSTVFLIMAGDMERSLRLLLNLSSLLTSAFIWPVRIHASVHVPVEVAESGIPPVYWCTAHYVEMLLKAEVPLVHSAFRMSGFTPSQMCLHWLTQCFWNYLDWTEICHYVSTCVVMGPDYQVYMCVAIFKHLQPDILQRTQSQELQVFLKEEPIQGFKVGDYLELMEGLERSYRHVVLTDMKTIRNPVD
uniref:Protein broad-minded n=1 Tax=Sander lucioperca TaxID=283035 RepID=A0A8D0CYK9_SANLU